jgi:pimeloyl-ACP methyl ester carboxylesterase
MEKVLAKFAARAEANKASGRRGGPPSWALSIMKYGWGKKISPFSVARFIGRKQTLKMITNYVERRQKVDNQEQAEGVRDYMYQIFMRPGTTEYALMMCFELGLYPKLSLGHPDRLPSLPIPITFVYGDQDWVRSVDNDAGRQIVNNSQFPESAYYLVQSSDHNMHMDNPLGFSNIIITDLVPNQNLDIRAMPEDQGETDFEQEFLEDMHDMSEWEQVDLGSVQKAEANQDWDEPKIQKVI